MASRLTTLITMKNWRSTLSLQSRVGHSRSFASSTPPKFAPNSSSSSSSSNTSGHKKNKYALIGEYTPIYMVAGMVVIVITLAVHSVKQQLWHHPGVYVINRTRDGMPELDSPHTAKNSGGRFLDKSFLRKVGHIQDDRNKP